MANLVLIEQAAKNSTYSQNYIGELVRKGRIKGEKHGAVWLIDLDSLKVYEAQIQEQGPKKHNPTKYKVKS